MGALPCPLFSEGAKKAAVDTQGLAPTDFLWWRERNLVAGGEWSGTQGSPAFIRTAGNTSQTNIQPVLAVGLSDLWSSLASCLYEPFPPTLCQLQPST